MLLPLLFLSSPIIRRPSSVSCSAKKGASVRIEYCTGCKWMLRSSYFSQEILSTFDDGSVAQVTLVPSYSKPGGDFTVHVDDTLVWDRRRDGGFPQVPELKRRIRDVIEPERDLGHSEGAAT